MWDNNNSVARHVSPGLAYSRHSFIRGRFGASSPVSRVKTESELNPSPSQIPESSSLTTQRTIIRRIRIYQCCLWQITSNFHEGFRSFSTSITHTSLICTDWSIRNIFQYLKRTRINFTMANSKKYPYPTADDRRFGIPPSPRKSRIRVDNFDPPSPRKSDSKQGQNAYPLEDLAAIFSQLRRTHRERSKDLTFPVLQAACWVWKSFSSAVLRSISY